MTSYYTTNMNFQNECVSPITPSHSSENSLYMKCLRSGVTSDYSSPYLNRPMISYITGSGGGSGSGSSRGSNRTPLSPMQLSPLVRVEEDVFVMDGVTVGLKSGSKGGIDKFSLSSGVGGSLYKTELCKSWEDSGYCRYGIKCQFAHGQEELRTGPNRPRTKKKIELNKSKPVPLSFPANLFSPDNKPSTPATASSSFRLTNPSPPLPENWSPTDDGIAVTLPGSSNEPSRADVDEYIDNVLYRAPPLHARKRLPVFRGIFPNGQ